jgi:hypothetical protein
VASSPDARSTSELGQGQPTPLSPRPSWVGGSVAGQRAQRPQYSHGLLRSGPRRQSQSDRWPTWSWFARTSHSCCDLNFIRNLCGGGGGGRFCSAALATPILPGVAALAVPTAPTAPTAVMVSAIATPEIEAFTLGIKCASFSLSRRPCGHHFGDRNETTRLFAILRRTQSPVSSNRVRKTNQRFLSIGASFVTCSLCGLCMAAGRVPRALPGHAVLSDAETSSSAWLSSLARRAHLRW